MSVFGDKVKIDVFGASHANEIGVTISGLEQGFALDMDAILTQMGRRAPGKSDLATPRKEPDLPIIESGVENNITTGDTIKMVIKNTNQHSKDYGNLRICPRPGHADYTAYIKYGENFDMSGGGPFSGRMMAPIVFAGEICRQILNKKHGIDIVSHILSIADIKDKTFCDTELTPEMYSKLKNNAFAVIDDIASEKMRKVILDAKSECDSVGGIVECEILNMPAGVGGEIFGGLESAISGAMFSIPACKGVEFGSGFDSTKVKGSENNDEFMYRDGEVVTKTNNCGGILGGISNGMPINFKVAFKPTPSISRVQNTVNLQTKENVKLEIVGRHDPCIVCRVCPVVEAMAAIAIINMIEE